MFEIELVAVGSVDRSHLELLSTLLSESILLPCSIRRDAVDLEGVYDDERRQYNSTEILARIASFAGERHRKVLGIADVDLFIPFLTYVFGEAQLGNSAAVMSLCRLRQEFYGLPPDENLFYYRAHKEAIHELGHTFGFVHCPRFDCVMHFSNSIEDVDIKPDTFCDACADLWRTLVASSTASE